MSTYKTHLVDVDRTFYAGKTPPSTYDPQSEAIEGTEWIVTDLPAAGSHGPQSQSSAVDVTVRLVRNVHATTCEASELVKVGPTDKFVGRTAGQAGTVHELCIGVVHHRCTPGIRQHDLGPVVVYGPVWVKKVAGALSVGQQVGASATAGKVQLVADTSTDDTSAVISVQVAGVVGAVMKSALSGDALVQIFVGKK